MGLYDRPGTSISSEATVTLDALLSVLDAFESLAQTLRPGETPVSHVSALLERAERRTSSLRNILIELQSFYETRY